MLSKNVKINPIYALLIIIAVLFAFGPLWLNYTNKIEMNPVKLKWINVLMPGKVKDNILNSKTGVMLVSSSDGKRISVITLIPADEGSEIRKAFDGGEREVIKIYDRLFATQALEKIKCKKNENHEQYKITAIRSEDKWKVVGSVRFDNKINYAVVVLSSARRKRDIEFIHEKIINSIEIKVIPLRVKMNSQDVVPFDNFKNKVENKSVKTK
jgi:hypothetical protein